MHQDLDFFIALQPCMKVRPYQFVAIDSSDVCIIQPNHHAASTSCWAIGSRLPATRRGTALEGGGWSFSQYQQRLVSRSSAWFHMAELRWRVFGTFRSRFWSLIVSVPQAKDGKIVAECLFQRFIDVFNKNYSL